MHNKPCCGCESRYKIKTLYYEDIDKIRTYEGCSDSFTNGHLYNIIFVNNTNDGQIKPIYDLLI